MAIGNIQGGPFQDWVTNQIEQREISLGKSAAKYDPETGAVVGKQNQDLLYQQSKTPWLRLASSANIQSTNSYGVLDRLLTLPDISLNDIEGDLAARNFILQGGALSLEYGKSSGIKSSVGDDSGIVYVDGTRQTFNSSYGWGGTTERGLVPMSGITGASVKYENDGALTKTTINIKCYSRTQFALVDALYMRPGYTLLLEFGWSAYLQTNLNDQLLTVDQVTLQNQDSFFSPALSLLLNPKRKTQNNQYKIIQAIKEERERTSGNYEAVFGKIVNFKWSMDPDGSYNCTVDLRGLGEVIESLKLNVSTPTDESKKISNGTNNEEENDETKKEKSKRAIPLVALGQAGGTLIQNLFTIYQTTKLDTEAAVKYLWPDKDGTDIQKNYTIKNFPMVSNSGDFFKKDITFKNGILGLVGTNTDEYNYTPQIYVKFGLLMALIQKNIVPTNGKNGAPIFTFDIQFDNLLKDKNLIRRLQGQFPIAPQHYMIPYSNHNLNDLERKYLTQLENFPTSFPDLTSGEKNYNSLFRDSGWVYNSGLGRLANVYVNVNRVATILLNQKGKINNIQKNEKDLFEFLRILLDEININLGGINNVRLKLPDEGARVRFIEDIPQTFSGNPPITYKSKMCRFNTFGFSSNNPTQRGGSIVRNLGIDASIPSNFSTMISIGAQNNGNQASGNATSFSNYNTGIIDRVIPTKSLVTSNSIPTDPKEVQFKEFAKTVKGLLSEGWWDQTWVGRSLSTDGGLFTDVFRDRNWYGDDMAAFNSYGTAYHQLLNGIYTQEPSKGGSGTLAAPFFLPFNLNMDIDGMSGIVMMQRFEIDQKILPPSYDKDSVEIMVKSVDHEITKESWITKLGTQSVPKIKLRKPGTSKTKKGGAGGATSKGSYNNYRSTQPARTIDRTDSQLRMILTLVEDLQYATLGVLEILSADQSTVTDTLAVALGANSESSNLYDGGDRFECVFDNSQKYPNAILLIGNSKNNYDYNNLYSGKGSVSSNVLMYAGQKGTGPNIAIRNGFMSAHPESQITKVRTGLGVDVYAAENSNLNALSANIITSRLKGARNWYMDVVDITSNTASGAQITQGNLSKSEKKKQQVRIFVSKLGRISPAAENLWNNNKNYDWETSEKKYKDIQRDNIWKEIGPKGNKL